MVTREKFENGMDKVILWQGTAEITIKTLMNTTGRIRRLVMTRALHG
jgi:hypothetical protein